MCTACAAGTFAASSGGTSSASCLACPAGTYAATGAIACTSCPPGITTTGMQAGSASVAACTTCAAGYAGTVTSPGTTSAAGCVPCAGGTAAAAGSASCAVCGNGTHSYGGSACSPCAAGSAPAAYAPSSSSCAPSATLSAGPADAAFYLSGSAAEGLSAFSVVGVGAFTTGVFGASSGALVLANGGLSAPGAAAPPALPLGNASAWTMSAWVKCAPQPTGGAGYAAVLEWGAAGDVGWSAAPTAGAAGLGASAASLLVAGASAWATGAVTTIAGRPCINFCTNVPFDGTGTNAFFPQPLSVAFIPSSGALAVIDGNAVRIVSHAGVVTTLAGNVQYSGYADGVGTAALFSNLRGIAVVAATSTIVLSDAFSCCIRLVTLWGAVSSFAGGCGQGPGFADGTGAAARFSNPSSVAVIQSTGAIVVADSGNRAVRLISQLGVVTTLAGSPNCPSASSVDGVGTSACFASLAGIAIMPSGSTIVVIDNTAGTVRFITLAGSVSTFPGFLFNSPFAVAVIPSSGAVLVTSAGMVQMISAPTPAWPAGQVSLFAGSFNGFNSYNLFPMVDGVGTAATFSSPTGIAVNTANGAIAIIDNGFKVVRIIQLAPVFGVCDSAWHHIALSYSPAAAPLALAAFIDGSLAARPQLLAPIALPAAAAGASLRVGWSGDAASNFGGSPFSGALADLRVYNRSLSAAEVAALAQPPLSAAGGLATTSPSLAASSYTYACVSGAVGAPATLLRNPADFSWAWAGAAPACVRCPAGSWAPAGAAACAPCYPGTFSASLGAAACSLCPAGTFGSQAGLNSSSCSGACAACAAGSSVATAAAPAAVTCAPSGARAVPPALGLQLWPAANPANPRGVDLVVAPLVLCAQLTPGGVCNVSAANGVVGADGVTRFAVGPAAAFNVQAGEAMTCSANL